MRTLLAPLLLLLALVVCKDPANPIAATPRKIDSTSTPTLAPYWDLLPLTSEPAGAWKMYQNNELDFTFQYPVIYDKDECRRIWLEDKYWRDPPQTVLGLGSINIFVFETWAGDLDNEASLVASVPESQVLTAVESFSIDELPAFRLIYRNREAPNTEYVKRAFVAFAGTLYQFSYTHLNHVMLGCEALPFSEEAVYDHLLSTVEFKH